MVSGVCFCTEDRLRNIHFDDFLFWAKERFALMNKCKWVWCRESWSGHARAIRTGVAKPKRKKNQINEKWLMSLGVRFSFMLRDDRLPMLSPAASSPQHHALYAHHRIVAFLRHQQYSHKNIIIIFPNIFQLAVGASPVEMDFFLLFFVFWVVVH